MYTWREIYFALFYYRKALACCLNRNVFLASNGMGASRGRQTDRVWYNFPKCSQKIRIPRYFLAWKSKKNPIRIFVL